MYVDRMRRLLLPIAVVASIAVICGGTPRTKQFKLTQCEGRTMNKTSYISQHTDVKSAIDCSSMCAADAVCMSVTYIAAEKQCTMFETRDEPLNCANLVKEDGAVFMNMDSPCVLGEFLKRRCDCPPTGAGEFCENRKIDCTYQTSIYEDTIYPYSAEEAIPIVCNGLRIRVLNIPYNCNEFNRDWATFRGKFQTCGSGYWAGNKWISRITQSAHYVLYVYLYSSSSLLTEFYYDNFVIDDENNFFTLHYSSYNKTGSADSFLINGAQFRTHDYNNNGCATTHNAGFWYEPGCPYAPPTIGTFSRGGPVETVYTFYMELIRMDS